MKEIPFLKRNLALKQISIQKGVRGYLICRVDIRKRNYYCALLNTRYVFKNKARFKIFLNRRNDYEELTWFPLPSVVANLLCGYGKHLHKKLPSELNYYAVRTMTVKHLMIRKKKKAYEYDVFEVPKVVYLDEDLKPVKMPLPRMVSVIYPDK